MQVSHFKVLLKSLGASIPGFFADQSPETLDYMVKTSYYTALWTSHVLHLFALY